MFKLPRIPLPLKFLELWVHCPLDALDGDKGDVVNFKAIEQVAHRLGLPFMNAGPHGELAAAPDTTLIIFSVLHDIIEAHKEEVVVGIIPVKESQVLQSKVQFWPQKASDLNYRR